MTADDLPPLPEDLRELLDAERVIAPLPPAVSARIAERLAQSLALPPADAGEGGPGDGGGGAAAPPSASPPTTGSASASTSGSSIAGATAPSVTVTAGSAWSAVQIAPVALAFVLGGATGAGITARILAPSDEPPRAAEVRAAQPHAGASVPALVPSTPPARALEPAPDMRAVPPAGPGLEPPQPKSQRAHALDGGATAEHDLGDRDLRAERQLLELARTALTRADGEEALAALERHASRFPRGRLAEERHGLRVPVLVLLGRGDEARRSAARFHARYRNSLFAPAVDRALQSIP